MDNKQHEFRVSAEGIQGMTLLLDKKIIKVDSGTVYDLPVRIRASEENLTGRSTTLSFTLTTVDNQKMSVTQDAKFLGPIQ